MMKKNLGKPRLAIAQIRYVNNHYVETFALLRFRVDKNHDFFK